MLWNSCNDLPVAHLNGAGIYVFNRTFARPE
jgi:hypothetical protein